MSKGYTYRKPYCCEQFQQAVEMDQIEFRGPYRRPHFKIIKNLGISNISNEDVYKVTYDRMNYCYYCGQNMKYVGICST